MYDVPASYDLVGNLTSYTDTVMSTWNRTTPGGGSGYDTLTRLAAATLTWPDGTRHYGCWSYDPFGNRTVEAVSTTACGSSPTLASWAHYNGTVNGTNNNQMSQTGQNVNQASGYDRAGDVTNDGIYQYLYDGDGRICAVAQYIAVLGTYTYTGYLYDADGTRVAKGSLTGWSCDPALNGFQTTNDYVLGLGGEQAAEMGVDPKSGSAGALVWQHTNAWGAGELIATYDNDGLHFYFNDPLGTRRAQTDSAGNLEQTCASLPFGDGLNCSNSTQYPTEHHFTGKERDQESGNDYFGARYYASTMGRWLSPDWSANAEPVPYATLGDPQSLNLYQYVRNNPLKNSDADGHECPPDCMGGFLLSKDDAACDCGGGSDGPAGKIFLEASAAIMAGPEVGALAAEATTIGQGLAAGAAALGVTGTAVNAVTDTVGAATHTNVDEATNAVTALTNPVAAGVSLATGSTEKGSQAADFATVAKAGAGLAQGKVPSNPADVANSLKGAKEAVAGVVDKAKSSISGALAPAPSAPSAPPAPRPPACGSTPGAC